jgi:hypothetical protein
MSFKQSSVLTVSIVSCLYYSLMFSCSNSENPFSNPDNVTIDLIVPDTTDHTIYTLDSTTLTLLVSLTSLIDSIALTVNDEPCSVYTSIQDSMPLTVVFNDSGEIAIKATAYCEKGITKECEKTLIVHKNPLVPPNAMYAEPRSDSSIYLYWKKVRVAKKYRVYRSLSATTTFSMIKTVADTSYLDTALTDSTTYYYRVSSIDSLNRESARSSIFSATTLAIPLSKWDQMVWDRDAWE